MTDMTDMVTATVEVWNPAAGRTLLYQVVIMFATRQNVPADGTRGYTVYLLEPGVKVPTQGPNKGKIPHDKVLSQVITRHVVADGPYELLFRAMRELRQENIDLFESQREELPGKANHIRKVFG